MIWIKEFVELQLRYLLSLLSNHRILRKFHRYCRTRSPHVIFGLPVSFSGTDSRAHPRAITFPPRGRLLRGVTFLKPIHFPQHLLSVHDHGRLRSSWEPQLLPALTWVSLYIEPSPCRGVRPAGNPVDSDPGARLPWSPPWIERWSLQER